nr:hypothetical protein B0A51_17981 [Rachicladosporium sp. CCFEE 5018]
MGRVRGERRTKEFGSLGYKQEQAEARWEGKRQVELRPRGRCSSPALPLILRSEGFDTWHHKLSDDSSVRDRLKRRRPPSAQQKQDGKLPATLSTSQSPCRRDSSDQSGCSLQNIVVRSRLTKGKRRRLYELMKDDGASAARRLTRDASPVGLSRIRV